MADNVMSMPESEPAFSWEESPSGLRVCFPIPNGGRPYMWLVVAAYAVGLVLIAIVAVATFQRLVDDPTNVVSWGVSGVVGLFAMWFGRYMVEAIDDARAPRQPLEPSELFVSDGELRIERTGIDRDIDVCWDLSEVSEIHLSPTIEYPFIYKLHQVIAAVFHPTDAIGFNVVSPSGDIDEVVIRVPSKHWITVLEGELRCYLHQRFEQDSTNGS